MFKNVFFLRNKKCKKVFTRNAFLAKRSHLKTKNPSVVKSPGGCLINYDDLWLANLKIKLGREILRFKHGISELQAFIFFLSKVDNRA